MDYAAVTLGQNYNYRTCDDDVHSCKFTPIQKCCFEGAEGYDFRGCCPFPFQCKGGCNKYGEVPTPRPTPPPTPDPTPALSDGSSSLSDGGSSGDCCMSNCDLECPSLQECDSCTEDAVAHYCSCKWSASFYVLIVSGVLFCPCLKFFCTKIKIEEDEEDEAQPEIALSQLPVQQQQASAVSVPAAPG